MGHIVDHEQFVDEYRGEHDLSIHEFAAAIGIGLFFGTSSAPSIAHDDH
jgi:hypothetical protein